MDALCFCEQFALFNYVLPFFYFSTKTFWINYRGFESFVSQNTLNISFKLSYHDLNLDIPVEKYDMCSKKLS